ncbi:MAG: hypothetical protein NTY53_14365 [Kiritimatiellaeota bacterium]|nr:hypothetical protein [Kiritimatiellota bacterium]
MVEVALALLILSIGVLTMVGLMSGGLDMSKSAVDFTQTSIFANDTLEGVRYYASTVTNGASKFWSSLKGGLALKAVMGGVTSIFDTDTQNETMKNSTAYGNFFYSYQTNVDFACRYRVSIEQSPGLTGNLVDQVASVKLDVINGLYGAATTQSFYTEVIQLVR